MDQREKELECADSNVSVTRADRLLGHARWLAERLDAETYGQRSHITYENVTDLADALARAEERRERDITHDAPQQLEDSASIIEGDS